MWIRNELLTIFLCLTSLFSSFSQNNFRAGWDKSDPVTKDSPWSVEEKIQVHQEFLLNAEQEGNPLKQIYGHVYLVYDYCLKMDYINATESILQAQVIAEKSGNTGWQGWVMHRKANVSLALKKYDNALREYQKSAELCSMAQDSLCLAESLDLVSYIYYMLNDFTNAVKVSRLAIPMIEKYGGETQLGVSLNNLGLIFSGQPGKVREALPYLERSLGIFNKQGKLKDAVKVMNNLADAHIKLHQFANALALLNECKRINEENNYLENLSDVYLNLSSVYDSIGNYREANRFLLKASRLTDSLLGADTRLRIANMEFKYANQQKELELEKTKLVLQVSQHKAERQVWIIATALLLTVFSTWLWYKKTQQSNRNRMIYQNNLENLTRLLLEKNTRLVELEMPPEEKFLDEKEILPFSDVEVNLFNQNILTESDWVAFKSWFEKSYPGYLLRLRKSFPTITEAEERLFLFVKCNLNTKESANILGISVNSVKKTRHRLRQRLKLSESVDLDDFIKSF